MCGWVSWKRKCESWRRSGLFGLSFLLYGSIASIKCKYLSVPVTFFLFLPPRKRIQTQTLDVSLTWSSSSWNFSFYLILHLYRIQFPSLQCHERTSPIAWGIKTRFNWNSTCVPAADKLISIYQNHVFCVKLQGVLAIPDWEIPMSCSLSLSGTLNILIQMNSYDIWLGKVSCQQGVEWFFFKITKGTILHHW